MGALTNKDNSYGYRPWEVKTIKTVDIEHKDFESINIDIIGKKVTRIRPNIGEKEWILDTIRFKEKRNSPKKSLLNVIKRKEMIINMKKYVLKKRKMVEKRRFKVLKAFKKIYKENKDIIFLLGRFVDGKMISVIRSYVKMQGVNLKISSYFSEHRVSMENIGCKGENDVGKKRYINRTGKVEGYSKSMIMEGKKSGHKDIVKRSVPSNVNLIVNRENYKLLRKKNIKNMCNLSSVIIYDRKKQSSIKKACFSTYNAGMKEADMYIRVATSLNEIRAYIDSKGRQKKTKIVGILNISMINVLCGSLCCPVWYDIIASILVYIRINKQ